MKWPLWPPKVSTSFLDDEARFKAWQDKAIEAAMNERCPYCGRALVTLPRCPGCGAPQ